MHFVCVQDQDDVPASGEEIYFPALDVGIGKTSTVASSLFCPLCNLKKSPFLIKEDHVGNNVLFFTY